MANSISSQIETELAMAKAAIDYPKATTHPALPLNQVPIMQPISVVFMLNVRMK